MAKKNMSWGEDSVGAESQAPKSATGGKGTSDLLDYKNRTPEEHQQSVNNVKGVYQSAPPEMKQAGKEWYPRAKVQARGLANALPYSVGRHDERATAAIARLSPSGGGMDWDKNVPAAHQVNKMSAEQVDQAAGGNRSSLAGGPAKHASNYDIGKAHAVMHGQADPEEILTTQKIGHFYGNIRGSQAMKTAAANHPEHDKFYGKVDPNGSTVDGRADSIIKGRHVNWGTNIGLSTQGRYDNESGVYKDAGRQEGVSARTMQATTWTAGEMAGRKGGGARKTHGAPLDYTSYSPGASMKERHQATKAKRRDNWGENMASGQALKAKADKYQAGQ